MNELLLLLTVLLSVLFVFVGWKLGKERLFGVIIVFLILVATVGAKLVFFFGHETNAGNIFYASVFLATYFLIERYGKREGILSIWVGVGAILFFELFVRLSLVLIGSDTSALLNSALSAALAPSLQIAAASLVAYIFSQNLNVRLYLFLKDRWRGQRLWLRANLANAAAQLLDSVIFFTIAFWGAVGRTDLIDIILTGLVLKILFMMVASPLLYLNKIQEEENGDGSISLTIAL